MRRCPVPRVLVSFGRRALTGVIVKRTDGGPSPARKLKPLLDVLDARPAMTPELLELTRWVSDYTLCAWSEAIKAALPSGTEVETRRVVHGLAGAESWTGDPRGTTILDALAEVNGTGMPVAQIATVLGRKTVPQALLRQLEAAGALRIDDEIQDVTARIKTERHLRLADDALDRPEYETVKGARQLALLDVLRQAEEPIRQADALRDSGASSSTVKSLVGRGLVEAFDAEVERRVDDFDEIPAGPPPDLALHPFQVHALDAITDAITAQRRETFLLQGVTGSGKTEVYLRALRAALDRGQSAIVLVPEIALTPQTVRRFRAHFGDRVAVLHSRMSPGERLDAWNRIRDGVYPIVIGPRSAVFAPVQNLGLVVVDEEHESSYKQFDPAPRYHARDVAVLRAHRAGAVCVLGSATPSLESVANATAGKYTFLQMPDRVPVKDRPRRAAAARADRRSGEGAGDSAPQGCALAHDLREAMAERLKRNEQTILLQNRRGYAPVLTCEDCGWTPMCRDCAVLADRPQADAQPALPLLRTCRAPARRVPLVWLV